MPTSGAYQNATFADRGGPLSPQQQAVLVQALAAANHFHVDDLVKLRAGNLGSSGARLLLFAWFVPAWRLLAAGVALALTVVAVLVNSDLYHVLAGAGIFIFLVLFTLGGLFGALKVTLDVLGGRVTSADGWVQRGQATRRVGIGTSHYYYIEGQKWNVSSGAYNALIVGPKYRVYFLPRSKALVGLEPIGDARSYAAPDPIPPTDTSRPQDSARYAPAVRQPEQTLSELAAVFNFSPDVLPANRAGQMTDKQAVGLVRGAVIYVGCFGLFSVAFLVFVGVFFLWPQFSHSSKAIQAQMVSFAPLLCLPILALAFVSVVPTIPAWRAAWSKRVLTAAGIVSKRTVSAGRGGYIYIFRVDQQEWRAGGGPYKRRFDALTEGAAYRVYYTPFGHTILSIEPG